jgi:multiple sugar transport system permease protein
MVPAQEAHTTRPATPAFTDNDENVAAAQSAIVALTAFVLSFGFLWPVNRMDRQR